MSIGEFSLNIQEASRRSLSLYIHIPFCNSKCSYCNFVSSVASDLDKKRYLAALVKDIKLQSKKYKSFYVVSSIYIGGGTPSCLDYYFIRDILTCLYKNFAVKNSAEITIEINPNSIDKNKIREYIMSGVNRFSIGLQSTSPKILKLMGRTHSVEDFKNAVDMIREQGINNISADIILGYPKQKLSDIKETINFLIKMGIPHISAYMLQVETGTALKKLVDNGSISVPADSTVINMYNYVYKTLSSLGYNRYEFSNFAKPTFESYHNQIYWKRKDYLGLGLAAHSYIDGTRFAVTENLLEYIETLESDRDTPIAISKALSIEEKKEEAVMLSLRTSTGLNLEEYKSEFGENFLAKKKDIVIKLIKEKFLILTSDNHLVCTDKGYLVLNQIILQLV